MDATLDLARKQTDRSSSPVSTPTDLARTELERPGQSELLRWLQDLDTPPPGGPPHETDAVADPASFLPQGDRYLPGSRVGRGGMGEVVLARDTLLGRTVALKRLHTTRPTAEQLRRFLLEAQVTGQLDHPGIVGVHDVGVDRDGYPYYAMQYVRGNETLRDVIDRLQDGDPATHARYTMERRVQVVIQVLRALDYAHRRGVVHRDVKPDNIMVGRFGEVLLVDWGLARVETPAEARCAVEPVTELHETSSNQILGTPFYMAPEQILTRAEPASDVYAVGAVLAELTGLRHYLGQPATTFEALAQQILHQPPLPPDGPFQPRNGRVPAALAAVCLRALAKAPADRHESAGAVADELQRWLEGDCPVQCPNSLALSLLRRWRRALVNHPRLATLASLAVLLLFVLSLAITVGVGLRLALG